MSNSKITLISVRFQYIPNKKDLEKLKIELISKAFSKKLNEKDIENITIKDLQELTNIRISDYMNKVRITTICKIKCYVNDKLTLAVSGKAEKLKSDNHDKKVARYMSFINARSIFTELCNDVIALKQVNHFKKIYEEKLHI